jgi:hypothetical protein
VRVSGSDLSCTVIESEYRKKLQMEHGRLGREADDELPHFSREVREPEDDDSSIVHIEVPPWAESYEITSTTVEGA